MNLQFRLNPYHQEPFGSAAERRRRKPKDYNYKLDPGILTGADQTDYGFLDAYIRKNKPARVLELGGGVTTYVMAKAMKDIGYGELISIEHIKKYADATMELLPYELYSAHVKLRLTSIVGDRYNGTNVLRYDEIPPGPYDMIFCDFTDAIGGYGGHYFPHIDPLLMLENQYTTIITDRKLYSLHHYARWISCPVYYDPVYALGFVRVMKSELGKGSRLKLGNIERLLD